MSNALFNTLVLGGVFLLLFGLAELLYYVFKLKAELTRKFVHFNTGFITLLFPSLIDNHWYVLLLCASFAVLLVSSKRFGFLKSINAIDRKSSGSLLYPIVVYGCYLLYDYFQSEIFYFIPILSLAVADPIAALVGKKWPLGKYTIFGYSKTLSGSGAFFLFAFVSTGIVGWLQGLQSTILFTLAISVALATTVAEAVSHRGLDNLTIPLAAALTCMMLL